MVLVLAVGACLLVRRVSSKVSELTSLGSGALRKTTGQEVK